jgi:hypothetical protein
MSDHDDRASTLRYDDLVFACTHLSDLLEVENEALDVHDRETVSALIETKTSLAQLYENAMGPLAEDPSLVDTLEPEQREELTALGLRLAELSKRNAILLTAAIDGTQMVIDRIAEAVRAGVDKKIVYGNDGVLAASANDRPHHTMNKLF